MSARSLIFLAAIAALLGGFIYFFEKDLPGTAERQELDKKVLAIEPADVQAFEVKSRDRTVRLEKKAATAEEKDDSAPTTGASWTVSAGGKSWRAATSQVDELLRQLADLRRERKFEQYDADQTGLAKPTAEVTLFLEGGRTEELAVGQKLSLGEALLVGYGGAAYQVQAGAGFLDLLDKEPGAWREKLLFHHGRGNIEKLTLPGAAGPTVLVRRGEGENFWIESSTPADLADRDLVAGLLTDVSTLEASRFLGDDAVLPAGARAIDVAVKGKSEPFRVEIGPAVAGKSVARVDGQLVEVGSERLLAALDKPPIAWRSTFWSPLQVFGIDHATFEQNGQKTEIHRVDGEWRRGADQQDKLDFAVASDALYPIVESKAQEVLTRAEAGARGFALNAPRLAINLRTADISEDLAVYPAVGGLAPATSSAREVVLLLPEDKVQELERKVATLHTAVATNPAPVVPGAAPATGDATLPAAEEDGE